MLLEQFGVCIRADLQVCTVAMYIIGRVTGFDNPATTKLEPILLSGEFHFELECIHGLRFSSGGVSFRLGYS